MFLEIKEKVLWATFVVSVMALVVEHHTSWLFTVTTARAWILEPISGHFSGSSG